MGAKKAEKKTKEAVEKYKASKKVLMKIDATCKAKAKLKYLTSVKIKKVAKIVASLEKTKVKACKAEQKAHEKAQKGKEKLLKAKRKIAGPGFKFGKDPCKKGANTFTQKLVLNQRVNVGLIPAGKVNVRIELNTNKDVDTELWTPDGKRAIVGWQCGSHQKKKLIAKCIDSATAKTAKFRDITIKTSGYLGMKGKFGHEFIQIVGKSKYAFLIRAFAYEAGTANVKYSWDKDPKPCKKLKKEKSTKALYKKQFESQKTLSNDMISQMLKTVRSCKAASSALLKVKATLAISKKAFSKVQVSYKKCEAKKAAHLAKMKKKGRL